MPVLVHRRSTLPSRGIMSPNQQRPARGQAVVHDRDKPGPHRRENQSVKPVQHTRRAPGIRPLEFFIPKTRFRNDSPRSPAWETIASTTLTQASMGTEVRAEPEGEQHARKTGGKRPADKAGPGLVRRNDRRELRAADHTSGEERAGVGGPDHEKQVEDGVEAVIGVLPDRDQRDRRKAGVIDASGRPPGIGLRAPATRAPRTPSRSRAKITPTAAAGQLLQREKARGDNRPRICSRKIASKFRPRTTRPHSQLIRIEAKMISAAKVWRPA